MVSLGVKQSSCAPERSRVQCDLSRVLPEAGIAFWDSSAFDIAPVKGTLIINRTLVYTALTATSALVYFGGVRKYIAAKTLEAFSAKLRDETDSNSFSLLLSYLGFIDATMGVMSEQPYRGKDQDDSLEFDPFYEPGERVYEQLPDPGTFPGKRVRVAVPIHEFEPGFDPPSSKEVSVEIRTFRKVQDGGTGAFYWVRED
jgi:hypothetical protein